MLCVVSCAWLGAYYLHIPPLHGSFHNPWGVSNVSAAMFMLEFMWPVAVVGVPILEIAPM